MRLPFTAQDPACPEKLRTLLRGARPPVLTVSRPLALPAQHGRAEHPRAVAIVGARLAHPDSVAFTKVLARLVVSTGGVVLSGGALGVDGTAHEAAMEAGGTTWCVAPTAPGRATQGNEDLFARIEASAGGIVWTLPENAQGSRAHFHVRNAVLVALAHLVLVVQAGLKSGSRSAATKALAIQCPLRIIRPATWSGPEFDGSRALIQSGRVIPLESLDDLHTLLGTPVPPPLVSNDADESDESEEAQLSFDLSSDQANLFQKVTQSPQHVDEIAHSVGIRPGQAATLLLTLALENVVVEGPSGFFRRQQLL